ncbi:MAG: hypothetical protein B7733_13425 [Myxococcales bacterium FL481]|nr:MAG: hypothetical protein B7733_13425 [Myxococcales bacterium FL481]
MLTRRLRQRVIVIWATAWGVLALPERGVASPAIPHGRTPVAALDVAGLRHHEVLHIDPGPLGPSGDYRVAIDAWTSSAAEHVSHVEGVRVWWLNRDAADERSPFGPTVAKRMRIEKTRLDAQHWTISIVTDSDRFSFTVSADKSGRVAAYGTVVERGVRVPDCLAQSARLVPRRLLGIPIGLRRLDVSCVDAQGQPHHGPLG